MDDTARITRFLDEIGLTISAAPLGDDEFLPGIRVSGGAIVYDPTRLVWPGDLLHEAGHLAVTEPGERGAETVDVEPALEMAAMAWSFAAARAIGIDPAIVFHEGGYRGASANYLRAYATGFGPGTPMLDWFGMTAPEGYPAMARWLR